MKTKDHPLRHGFSLTELLVVMGIFAVISVLVFPGFQRMQQNAKEAKCMSNLRAYGTAVLGYASDRQGFPWWDGNGESKQTAGSTYPNFEAWVRPYLQIPKFEQRLRCPMGTPEGLKNKNAFNYGGNGSLCTYYPKLQGIPVPVSRVVLAAEVYGYQGFSDSVHFVMTTWGVSEGNARKSPQEMEELGNPLKMQYHGGKTNRGLNLFFLDGHAALVRPANDDWWDASPTYGNATNGGYFYDQKQFQRMKAGTLQ